ncbi:MAG: FxsA family protein [bacterium]
MFFWLLILFITVPMIDLALLIKVGTMIGALNTILLTIMTGIVGAALARHQGLGVISRIRRELAGGHLPSDELLNGICILIGGFLLLTPGLLTDALGFALLIPPTRNLIKRYLRSRFQRKIESTFFIHR